jgi:hypothetical protein
LTLNLASYYDTHAGRDQEAELYLGPLAKVVRSFYAEYHQWPGPRGRIDDNFISELEGDPNAKINYKHINFYSQNNVKIMRMNRFGFHFQFYPDETSYLGFRVGTADLDRRTELPIVQSTYP